MRRWGGRRDKANRRGGRQPDLGPMSTSAVEVSGEKVKAMWDKRLTEIICDICIKEILKGNRPGTHFTKDGWLKIMTNFEKETGKGFSQRQLKNKWNALKKWKACKKLKGEDTGLGWNPIKRTVDASDDWWESRLQVVPEAQKFRTLGIDPEFEGKLDQMFMGIVTTGDKAWAPSSVKVLDNMSEEVPEASPLYFFALKLLLNKEKRIMFLSINLKIRALWLKSEMEDS
ncbi:L10-interacting MYB domain-containing protein [Gossypium raimondii]|nr:L10-interacting MYB domain-containing protein [Gossypium raimondii]